MSAAFIKRESANFWPYKGYSVFFVGRAKDVNLVTEVIKGIDPEEFNDYMPGKEIDVRVASCTDDGTIMIDGEDFGVIPKSYHGKFDLDLNVFYEECKRRGLMVFVHTQQTDDWCGS